MPQYTLVVWNIQNFGQGSERWGVNEVDRDSFIALFMKSIDADMLGVIETKPTAIGAARQLLKMLNATQAGADRDWAFDLIKSALKKDEALTSSAATSWVNGGPRREGYTFYWRTGRGFTVVPAARPISEGAETRAGVALPAANYLDLVTSGRPYELVDGDWSVTGGYTRASIWPIKDNAAVQPWPALGFLTVAKGGSKRPTYQDTRRPAFVVIKTKVGTDKTTLLPVLLFHSPSYGPLAEASVTVSSLSQQHYVTHPLNADGTPNTAALISFDNLATSGDYNHSETLHWPGAYDAYTGGMKKTAFGGVAATGLLVPGIDQTQTTIQLNDFSLGSGRYNGDPIDSADPEDYRKMSIDNLFYRTLAEDAGSGATNLIATVMVDGNAMRNSIKRFKGYLDAAIKDNDDLDEGGPFTERVRKHHGQTFVDKVYSIPDITDWPDFYNGVRRGYFGTARAAAEFVRYFISDHLPLIFKFTV